MHTTDRGKLRHPLFLLVSLAVMLVPVLGHSYAISTVDTKSLTVVRWQANKVTYYLHPVCSADMPVDKCKDALRTGFQGWMKAACTAMSFVEGYHCNTAQGKCLFDKGVSCKTDTDCPAASNLKVIPMGYNTNGRNEQVFVESNAWKFGQYVLGVTSPVFYNNGAIFEADIAYNGYHYKWVSDPGSIGGSYMDLLSVSIHEEGHFFGVQHMLPGYFSESDPPTMAPSVDPYGKSASLNTDDLKAICYLNPKDAQHSCANDSDCPYVNTNDPQTGKEYYSAKLNCMAGNVCGQGPSAGGGGGGGTTPGGSGELGSSCTSDSACKSGLFCQPYGNKGYCSQLCVPSQKNCPSGFACFAYQNNPGKGACLPSQGGTTQPTKKPGESCSTSSECTTLMCLSGVCRVKCTPKNPVECDPQTEMCAPIPSTGIGGCVPDTKPKLLPTGSPCDAPEACESGICLKENIGATSGICRQACTGKFTCPDGFACVPQSDGKQACLPGSDKLPPGSACTGENQCASGPCVAFDGKQFCSKTCSTADITSCPCGMACTASTAGDLCLPGAKVGCVEVGGVCDSAVACTQGAICVGGICQVACDVIDGDGCGPGQGCARLEPGLRAGYCSSAGSTPLSGTCASDADCASLFCDKDIASNDELRCLKPCDPLNPICGAGFACNALTPAVGACFFGDTPSNGGGADSGGQVGGLDASSPGTTSYGTHATTSDGCSSSRTSGRPIIGWLLGLVAVYWAVRRIRWQ